MRCVETGAAPETGNRPRLKPAISRARNRLVASPKVHFLGSGLAATLAGLTADHLLSGRDRMGHLLESFVVQQLVAQAAWTNPDLRFWHYRDRIGWRWTWS